MDALIRKRRGLKGKVTRIQSIIEVENAPPLEERRAVKYKGQLDTAWSELQVLHEELGNLCDDATFAPHQLEYDLLATRIETLQLKLPESARQGGNEDTGGAARNAGATGSVRLPRLELPTFDGDYREWSSFHDLFTATIEGNEQLSGAQKLQYLKASLRGQAALLLQSIQITDDNFKEAWDTLKKRFHNRREIINAHLKRLCSQPILNSDSPAALRKLIDTTNETVRALRVLKTPVEHWDIILVHLVAERLDVDSRRQWELSLTGTEIVTYAEFIAFLETRARALTTCGQQRVIRNIIKPLERKGTTTSNYHVNATKETCRICKGNHSLYKCHEFLQGSIDQRREMTRTHSLCYNCLSGEHMSKQCKAGSCRQCGGRHHTLLHLPVRAEDKKIPDDTTGSHHGSIRAAQDESEQVLLATAVIGINDSYDERQLCRALLDSGSQATFVTEACVQRLGLARRPTQVSVSGISSSAVNVSKGAVTLELYSCVDPEVNIIVEAFVLRKVTSSLPSHQCDASEWRHVKDLLVADPAYCTPNPIDLLLGADVLADVLLPGLRLGPKGTPIAQHSKFGWLVSGRVSTRHRTKQVVTNVSHIDLVTAVQRFWEMEEAPCSKLPSEEERLCEEHFANTYKRSQDGRFIVRLPFHTKEVVLDHKETRNIAIRRLKQVEQRLSGDSTKLQEYQSFLREYQELQHMEKILPGDPQANKSVYLPHHAVIKESSTTTRLRVVFDASAKGRNGLSLNDHLMVGPVLQDDIFNILIRFRTYPIAITADIGKMYRQIWVDESDTPYQSIVWRETSSDIVQDYRLKTVTYGTSSAPYLAIRCLQQLAKDHCEEYPQASAVTLQDFYVDDLMSGADTIEGAVELQKQLNSLLHRGGFELRKWASNSSAVLAALPDQVAGEQPAHLIEEDETVKTLGLRWNSVADHFSFAHVHPSLSTKHTKRTVLSTIARIYDPLGWLAPVTVKGKILLQQLWRTTRTWDEALPTEIEVDWAQYLDGLKHLESIKIRRQLYHTVAVTMELHGFCDASEKAFAAAVYSRVVRQDGMVEVTLLAAKTRVAPLKAVSIPRLELCGALLVSKLLETVRSAFRTPIHEVYAWTDSTITLAWINARSTRWKTFVANRVSQIQDKVPSQHWHHVRTEENPVDCASRGVSPCDLEKHPMWWNGPEFLKNPTPIPCKRQLDVLDDQVAVEERVTLVTQLVPPDSLIKRYSSLDTLTRVTAYLFRFVQNCKGPRSERIVGPLSIEEKNRALRHWIRTTQNEVFSQDVNNLAKSKKVHRGSQLATLNPFVDASGIIRVGGRLRNATIAIDQKFPILLPRKHDLTNLIVRQEHLRSLHAGPQLLLATLQQQFWILCGRDVIRQHVQQCVVCHRQRATIQRPLMGDLPAMRVSNSRPFLNSGVDYAGPFLLRALKLRGQKTFKAYVALFVCLSTHAIHLEVVSDLTTEAFIAAMKRFVARRGHCQNMFSDQGTNFVGANRELRAVSKLFRTRAHNDQVARHLSHSNTNWHFNPPAAPHFGGLWEAGVKSMKNHLRRVVGKVSLNFEEMSTVLSQIEACLNSRPLCPVSSNPNDLVALTPGHFLIGEPLTAMPDPDFTEQKISRLSRWQLVQRLCQHFWSRWSREYLSRLQQRPKAWSSSAEIKIHDLVLLREDNQPPTKWQLGRIQQVHPGKDGIIRVVTVKTQKGEFRRPMVKISKLPIDNPSTSA